MSAHLAHCGSCRLYAAELAHPSAQVSNTHSDSEASGDDLLAGLVPLRPTPERGALSWARVAILGVGALELAVAAIAFVGSGGSHETQERAAFELAMAMGLLAVAYEPRRASGLSPVLIALAAALLWSGLVEVYSDASSALAEAHHLLDVGAAWLVAVLATSGSDGGASTRHAGLP